jgi:hypothetical protein
VTVEENVLAGGFGSAVLEMFEEHGEHPPHFRRLGVRDAFVEHGSQAELRETHGLNADAVVTETLRMLGHAKTFAIAPTASGPGSKGLSDPFPKKGLHPPDAALVARGWPKRARKRRG